MVKLRLAPSNDILGKLAQLLSRGGLDPAERARQGANEIKDSSHKRPCPCGQDVDDRSKLGGRARRPKIEGRARIFFGAGGYSNARERHEKLDAPPQQRAQAGGASAHSAGGLDVDVALGHCGAFVSPWDHGREGVAAPILQRRYEKQHARRSAAGVFTILGRAKRGS